MYNRIVNQYKGFLSSASIFKGSSFTGFLNFEPFYEINDSSLQPYLAAEYPENLVLGKRVELFFLAAIKTLQGYQIIASNIQINNEQRTLGELDFIVKELKTNKVLHIELMFKFYVYDPSFPSEMERWIGPNRRDSLLQKLKKVKSNQFPLLHTLEAQKFLRSLGLASKDIEQQLFFKASMFVPEELGQQEFPTINNECIVGYWYHLENFKKYDQSSFEFHAPEKQDWPVDPKHGEKWVGFTEIYEQILELHANKKSPLVWIKRLDGVYERIIVVWW